MRKMYTTRNEQQPYLVIYQQFRSFKVPGRHSHIVFLVWVIKLCQTPVNETELGKGNSLDEFFFFLKARIKLV